MKIITPNVTATRIKSNLDGLLWQVGEKKYSYGHAFSKATDGNYFDFLYAPLGTELIGDIVSTSRGHVFQVHENQVTRQEVNQWNRKHWIGFAESDDHFYGDIEFVTYKNPKSKTGKLRTDKFASISIQREVNVNVHRKNGKRNVMCLPIELIVDKHPFTYDSKGNIINRESL